MSSRADIATHGKPRVRSRREVRMHVPAEVGDALRIRALRAGYHGNEISKFAAALVLKALGAGECRACGRLFRTSTMGPLEKTCAACAARARAATPAETVGEARNRLENGPAGGIA